MVKCEECSMFQGVPNHLYKIKILIPPLNFRIQVKRKALKSSTGLTDHIKVCEGTCTVS